MDEVLAKRIKDFIFHADMFVYMLQIYRMPSKKLINYRVHLVSSSY